MSVIALPRAEPASPRGRPGWIVLLTRRKTTLVGAILMTLMLAIGVLAPIIAGDPASA